MSIICSKRIAALLLCGFASLTLVGTSVKSEAANGPETAAAELAATDSPLLAAEETAETTSAEPSFVTIDSVPVHTDMHERMYGGISYVSLRALSTAMEPAAVISASGNTVTVKTEKLTLKATSGKQYIEANGRYLYVSGGVKNDGGIMLVPTRTIVQAFGGSMIWNSASGTVSITRGTGGITSGDAYYNAEDLKWLSLIIYSESGNQPLSGKIAVGNVIMNRVASSQFPGTVKGVILDRRGGVYQFTSEAKLIKRVPNEESIIAAKLTLEGTKTVQGALYFSTRGLNCWASRNRPYVTTIANHSFYA